LFAAGGAAVRKLFVEGDTRQLGGEARFAAKIGEPGEGANTGFLNHTLGLVIVTHDAPR